MPKKGEKKRGKTASTKAVAKESSKKRIRKATRLQARTKNKKDARSRAKLPGSFMLTGKSLVVIKDFWKPLFGIIAIYALLNVIFVSGLLGSINSAVEDLGDDKFGTALTGFSNLIASSGNSENASLMQSVLLVLVSLVIIWSLRHLLAGEKVGIKQAYYQSMTPLVPFLLVIFMIIIHLLPLAIGSAALTIVLATVLAESAIIVTIFILVFVLLMGWSIYLVSSSVFALYIVTLPDMQPLHALRSAKKLVRFRRWPIIRKLLFLPLFILLVMGVIIIPLIMFANVLVVATFFALSMLAVLYGHVYLYNLYKGLLA